MPDRVIIKSTRRLNAVMGVMLLLVSGCIFYAVPTLNESDLQNSQPIRGEGFLKLIVKLVGWHVFIVLLALYGLWNTLCAVMFLWLAVNKAPLVIALKDRIEFHPALRRSSASYNEVSSWTFNIEASVRLFI